MKYNFKKIEKKWQAVWRCNNFKVWQANNLDLKRKKFYVLDMFPYPSGEGLHVGHVEGYTASDIIARYSRMKGLNILHPMGWDAFGLPAENYAIKTKTHPRLVVEKNVKRFKKQLQSLGFSYDWNREINTTDPEYYKWTQWIFLKLFEYGLAYEAETSVNWCSSCKTVLANEEVSEGRCDRCGSTVEQKKLKQWLLKITAYADRLLKDLDELNWPERVKEMQRNWIGKSEGALIRFKIQDLRFKNEFIEVFTTRADTLFGATYVVLAPEHPIVVPFLKIKNQKSRIKNIDEVKKYIEQAKHKLERERISEEIKAKTGIELKGIKAINPVNNEEIPIFIADYVLAHYGTGAIMAVPAHDQRDWDFAKKYNLLIKQVIQDSRFKIQDQAYEGDGVLINSGEFNGIPSQKAKEAIIEWLNKKGLAEKTVNYKLRDWIFSRQRYWGEPIPLVFCENCYKKLKGILNSQLSIIKQVNDKKIGNWKLKIGNLNFTLGEAMNPGWIAVPESELPVKLPDVKKYQPTGKAESPLAGIKKWVEVKCPKCDGPAKRETNTMPQWAGSCWYYIAYLTKKDSRFKIQDSRSTNYWLPVDIYIGGVEHAVLHLLYARFWHKFLYDIGVVSAKEPFQKLVNQGLILGPDGQKMSKSRGNVINPDEIINQFGADSLRMYEMFMGPLENAKSWDPRGIVGIHRFLSRAWNLFSNIRTSDVPEVQSHQISNCRRQSREAGLEVEPRKIERDSSIWRSRASNANNNQYLGSPTSRTADVQKLNRLLHKTIKKVTEDIENFRFNTVISALMILLNEFEKNQHYNITTLQQFLKLLFPFVPHLAQELWSQLGNKSLLDYEKWPEYDPKLIREENFELLIQINGKLRDKVLVQRRINQKEVEELVLNREKVKKWIGKNKIKRIIFVPDRLINIII
jgi:leucyl-tRNA synthetase